MNSKELDLFCEIYEDKTILDKFSLIDIMLYIQIKTKDLQGIMSSPFSSSSTGSTNYDDLIYNTIDRLKYDRGADIEYIDKWLKEFEIDINDIVKNNFGLNEIGKYINVKHNDFQGTQEGQQKAHLIQVEFLDYFLKLYASNFLPSSYSGFDGRYKNEWVNIKEDEHYNVEFLNCFCKSIFDEIPTIKISFNLNYENNIKNFASKLHDEISDNVLRLSDFKIRVYLDYISKTIKKRQLQLITSENIDSWLVKYSLDIDDFPFFNNKKFNLLLNKDYKGEHFSVEERREVFKIQSDFFLYASMIESNKILDFIDSLKTSLKTPLDESNSQKGILKIDPIFKSLKGFNTFNYILDQLDLNLSTCNERGAQAMFRGIWTCPLSKEIIFKDHGKLENYVKYLKNIYNVEYKSYSMSNGDNYHISIEKYLSIYCPD
ncbi:MAG: hypothetical protein ACI87N_001191 [Flavobacteriales bacterium]|jgi:hypothetical protein